MGSPSTPPNNDLALPLTRHLPACTALARTHPQVMSNKRYAGNSGWTVAEVAEKAAKDSGKFDVLVSKEEQQQHGAQGACWGRGSMWAGASST